MSVIFLGHYLLSVMSRDVSRCLSRRRRLEIFNFSRRSAAAAKKLFAIGGGGLKLFGSRRRRLKILLIA